MMQNLMVRKTSWRRTREAVHRVHELLLRGREVRVLLRAEARGLVELRLGLGDLARHLRRFG